jgi:hypothetical protein
MWTLPMAYLCFGLLAVAWIAARRVAKKVRRREALRRRKGRASTKQFGEPHTASPRSDMRATDAPVTVIDTMRKRAWDPDR